MTLRTLLVAALLAGSLGAPRAQAQITLAVGGGPLPNLFTGTIAPMFEKATGKKLNVVTKNGQALTDAVKAGDVDVVVVDPAVLDGLIASGDITAASKTPVLVSKIGLAVKSGSPKPDISTPDKLKAALLAAKSIGHSRAPSGQAFMAAVEKLGITDAVTAKEVIPQSGPVGQLAVDGKAEIAVQQVAELLAVPGVDLIGPLPGDLQKFLPSSAGIPTKAKDAETAKALITFLRSAPVQTVLKEKGFDVP